MNTVGAAIHDILSSSVATTSTPPSLGSSVTTADLNSSLDISAVSISGILSSEIISPRSTCAIHPSVRSVSFDAPRTRKPTIGRMTSPMGAALSGGGAGAGSSGTPASVGAGAGSPSASAEGAIARSRATTTIARTSTELLGLLLLAWEDAHQLADDTEHDLIRATADRQKSRVA